MERVGRSNDLPSLDSETLHQILNQRLEPLKAESKALGATVAEHSKWIAGRDGAGPVGGAPACKAHNRRIVEMEAAVKAHQTFVDRLKGSSSSKVSLVQTIAMITTFLLATAAIIVQALALNGD